MDSLTNSFLEKLDGIQKFSDETRALLNNLDIQNQNGLRQIHTNDGRIQPKRKPGRPKGTKSK